MILTLKRENNPQDHKTKSIEYSHATCLWIVQIHCMYVHVMGIFALFLFFSQVDFAIVRLLADWLVTGYSTVWFIQVSICVKARTHTYAQRAHTHTHAHTQDKEVVPASSSRRRMGQQQDHDDTNEDEQRSMLPSGAKGELDDDDDIEMHIVPAAGDPRSSSAIITVYPRAFDKPEACFPHISSFSIGEEHEECNAAAASAATNNIDEYQKGPVTRSLISTGEDDEYEGDLVISSNGMHVGSIHAGSNDSGNRSRTSKKGRSSSVVRCFPPVTHTTPSEAAAASAKKNSKQGLKHGKKHRERLQDDNSESSECSDH